MTDDTLNIESAAHRLNVSVDYVEQLLASSALHLDRDTVLAFKAKRDADRRAGLRELTRLTEELGGYEKER